MDVLLVAFAAIVAVAVGTVVIGHAIFRPPTKDDRMADKRQVVTSGREIGDRPLTDITGSVTTTNQVGGQNVGVGDVYTLPTSPEDGE